MPNPYLQVSPKCGHIPLWYLTRCERQSKKRNIPYLLTAEEANAQWILQDGLCAITTTKIDFGKSKRHPEQTTASLDRIDSNKGYLPTNIQWVHKDINLIKNSFTDEYLIQLARKHYYFKPTICRDYIQQQISKAVWNRIVHNGTRYHNFEISKKEAEEQYNAQYGKCALTGTNIPLCAKTTEIQIASLDRIDSNYGYTKDNIQWVHKDINYMKYLYSNEYISLIFKLVYLVATKKKYGFLPPQQTKELEYYRQSMLNDYY